MAAAIVLAVTMNRGQCIGCQRRMYENLSVLSLMPNEINMNIVLNTIRKGFDYRTCWVAPQVAADGKGFAAMSMAKLTLTGCDVFDGSHFAYSTNYGESWSEPVQSEELKLHHNDMGGSTCCEVFPRWHRRSSQMVGFGHMINYTSENVLDRLAKRPIAFSVLDRDNLKWSKPKIIEVPEQIDNDLVQMGMQTVEVENGDILLPLACAKLPEHWSTTYVTRLRIEDQSARIAEVGKGLDQVKQPRGLYEPSLIRFSGNYYMALRNDITGYVTVSNDGLNYENPKPWCFDNGELLGNYNTQMRWVRNADEELYVVYNRRNVENDNVFRHRAPLLIAQVDTEKLCVLRDTERVLVPNRGARMGNFSVWELSPKKSWVSVAEWMQNDQKGFGKVGAEYCASFGSDNSVFIAEIEF